jgi:hypothetical protein
LRAVAAQRFDVLQRGGMLPHLAIHGRGDQNRGAGGERDGREGIVGEAVGHGGEDVRGGGGDEEQIGLVGELDVAGLPAFFFGKEIGDDRILAQRAQGERRDEFERGFRQHTRHAMAGLGELAGEVRRLVGRDGTGDAEDDAGHVAATINAKMTRKARKARTTKGLALVPARKHIPHPTPH